MLHRSSNSVALHPHVKNVCIECGQEYPCKTAKIVRGMV